MQLTQPQDSYLTSRAEALHNVESTITELGGIFQQLAHMVSPICTVHLGGLGSLGGDLGEGRGQDSVFKTALLCLLFPGGSCLTDASAPVSGVQQIWEVRNSSEFCCNGYPAMAAEQHCFLQMAINFLLFSAATTAQPALVT